MILSEFSKNLRTKMAALQNRPHSVSELARQLELMEFQLYSLIKDDYIKEELQDHRRSVSTDSIAMMRNDPDNIIYHLPLSTLELQTLLNLPGDQVGLLVSKKIIHSYSKKKRKGHLRSLFRLGQLLKKEKQIQVEVDHFHANLVQHKHDLRERYQSEESDLLARIVSTADRPAAPTNEANETQFLEVSNEERLEVSSELGYVLDPWQIKAIQSIENAEHVFVQAPTGSGKTAVVEQFLKRNLDSGLKLFYAVPIKALANDKFFDFCDLYGQKNVGINTGDITLHADAQIVIGTTEIVRNILLDKPDAYNVIAFDEAQYLGDPERGGAWEESIIMSSDETLLVFLSGSVANAGVVCNWIQSIKERTMTLYTETHRPVPLEFAFPFGHGFLKKEDWPSLAHLSNKIHRPYYENLPQFFEALEEAEMTPVLLFMPRRRDCEDVFKDIGDTKPEHQKELKALLLTMPDSTLLNLRLRRMIERKGCAYHHSGLLPPEKRVVEHLAKKGKLRFISATMSLASGVNFSVRTCYISEYHRPGNGGTMQELTPSEVLQMWGRAGRRGLDVEGYVVPCMKIEDTPKFNSVEAFPEAIVRDNFVSPVNLLSILSRFSVERLQELCQKSFSSFVEGAQYRVFSDETMIREAGAICTSPAYELPPYRQAVYAHTPSKELIDQYRCASCSNLKTCTKTYEEKIKKNPLQRMVKHLKLNGYLTEDFSLTFKGRLAERFHSEMGLLVAHDIVAGRVRPDNLVRYAATVSASGHIDFIGSRHRVHLDIAKKIYPSFLFPNLWENQRGRSVFINWNPGAGVIAEQWVGASDWNAFIEPFKSKNMQGDVFRALIRAGELLRSMYYLKDLKPELSEAARVATKLIMRPPLIPEELFVLA